MPRINPEGQITRAERLVTVIAVAGAVLIHVVVIFGWGRIYRWTQEEQKKERLMVIRRVRDIEPPRETIPVPARARQVSADQEGKVGRSEKAAPPPDPKVKELGPEPQKESELSPAMEQELEEKKPDQTQFAENGENAVRVVTDMPAASFIISGPAEYRGSGTLWVRKGAPPGKYTVTFNTVAGYASPPVQSKDLVARGQIVFIGKYRRSTEIVVGSNQPDAQFTIYRPDGHPVGMNQLGVAIYDDLPLGNYTTVFKDIPGYITPAPQSRTLVAGGKLSFYGEYGGGPAVRSTGGEWAREGDGSGAGEAKPKRKTAPVPRGAMLDRRVQMIITSYPPSQIEEDYAAIPYPEVIIRKSNFQQGWCQVYLILQINDSGEVERVDVERPQAGERPQFEALIKAVEGSVRAWDYDRVRAEVHVDVRFFVE